MVGFGALGFALTGCGVPAYSIASSLELKCKSNPNQVVREKHILRTGESINIGRSDSVVATGSGEVGISSNVQLVKLRGRELLVKEGISMTEAHEYAITVEALEDGNTELEVSLDCANPSGERR